MNCGNWNAGIKCDKVEHAELNERGKVGQENDQVALWLLKHTEVLNTCSDNRGLHLKPALETCLNVDLTFLKLILQFTKKVSWKLYYRFC